MLCLFLLYVFYAQHILTFTTGIVLKQVKTPVYKYKEAYLNIHLVTFSKIKMFLLMM